MRPHILQISWFAPHKCTSTYTLQSMNHPGILFCTVHIIQNKKATNEKTSFSWWTNVQSNATVFWKGFNQQFINRIYQRRSLDLSLVFDVAIVNFSYYNIKRRHVCFSFNTITISYHIVFGTKRIEVEISVHWIKLLQIVSYTTIQVICS